MDLVDKSGNRSTAASEICQDSGRPHVYRANVHRYILNDSDFQTITAQMTEQRQMKQIFFDVEESEKCV